MSDGDQPALSFPCDFPIKMFRETMLARVGQLCAEPAVSQQLSRNRTFVSLTVTVHAETRGQLETIYAALQEMREVLMVL
jgi:putative lipoic acid-binding regulatory protein